MDNPSASGPPRPKKPVSVKPLAGFLGVLLLYVTFLANVQLSPSSLPGVSTQADGTVPYLSVCLLKNLAHLPCPLCGLTRSMALLIQDHWAESLQYHILGAPVYVGIWLFLALFLLSPATSRKLAGFFTSRAGLAALALLFGGAWLWKLFHDPGHW